MSGPIDRVKSTPHSTDEDVKSTGGWFGGAVLFTDGTNDATLKIFDGNPGTRRFFLKVKGADMQAGGMLTWPIEMTTSIRVVITGSGADSQVFWQ